MKAPGILSHLRDILILPFSVTVLVPRWIIGPRDEASILFIAFGLVTGTIGLAFFLMTVFLFWKIGKGTLAPWSPKQKLVVEGPYRFVRNPMITGVMLILAGESLYFKSTAIFTWTIFFFLINVIHFMIYEEPDLEERFGEEYRAYKKNVPRWIPRLTPWKHHTI